MFHKDAPGADFSKLREEVDADLKHVELELDRLHHEARRAIKDHDQHAKATVIRETMAVEFHLHAVQVKLEAELKEKHGEVARYYLERKIEEVHVFFRQAADIFFEMGENREHHHRSTQAPHTTRHHHHHSTSA